MYKKYESKSERNVHSKINKKNFAKNPTFRKSGGIPVLHKGEPAPKIPGDKVLHRISYQVHIPELENLLNSFPNAKINSKIFKLSPKIT